MGGSSSKEDNWRQNSSQRSSPAAPPSWNAYPDPHLGYGQGDYGYEPQQPSYPTQPHYYATPPLPQNYGYEPQPQPHASGRVANHRNEKRLDRKYSRIADNYNSIDEVSHALLVVGDVVLCLTLAYHGHRIKPWLFYVV